LTRRIKFRDSNHNIPQPGIKLLDFFKAVVAGAGNTAFSTLKAQAISQSMKMLEPLDEDDVKHWMHYWKKEFLA
jgi:hypothetical protein